MLFRSDLSTLALGSCVDCTLCVQVCPTGIDIRQGLQYECIGCAACIDACDKVMDRMGYARGLIRYTTQNALTKGWNMAQIVRHALRPRIVVYTSILGAVTLALFVHMALRTPLKVDVLRDRGSLGREVEDGMIENVYRLQIMNTEEQPRRLLITASGVDDLKLGGATMPIEIGATSTQMFTVNLRAPAEKMSKGSTRIEFHIVPIDPAGKPDPGEFSLNEKSIFFKS